MTLVTQPNTSLTPFLQELAEKAKSYEKASLSTNTVRTYKSMWKKYVSWCSAHGLSYLPTTAENVAGYISDIGEEVSFSYLDSVLAAIEWAHEEAGQVIRGDHALYRRIRKGIRRVHSDNQTLKQAKPLTILDLKGACCRLGNSLSDYRDRALLTVAFFGAFRRSELVSLDREHVSFNDKGAVITLLSSKTSDTKTIIYLAYAKDSDICPVLALKAWLDCLPKDEDISNSPIYRNLLKGGKIGGRLSGHGVSEIIKRYYGKAYSGHSTRRGVLTSSAEKGTPVHILKKIGRHKSADMTMRYIENAKGFEDSSVNVLGV